MRLVSLKDYIIVKRSECMKKIIIVGATYGDNFGDMIFAKMITDALYKENSIKFYKLSEYTKNFIGEEKISDFPDKEADALIYMPGGFFGDRHDTSLLVTLYWFFRYFPIGLRFAFREKPILILGVGAGPCKYGIMRRIIKYICSKAKRIVVREDDSREFLKTLGIDSEVTSDLAQLITKYDFKPVDIDFGEKKRLLVHVNQNQSVASVIVPAVKRFYEKHKDEFSIVVASDQVCENDYSIFEQVCEFAEKDAVFYKYGDPMELCYIIDQCDAVVTYKLHMGIVACAVCKSVIALPVHYKKVERYYKHIGCPERSLPFHLADVDSVYEMIEKYYDKNIRVPDEILKATEYNYSILNQFISEL